MRSFQIRTSYVMAVALLLAFTFLTYACAQSTDFEIEVAAGEFHYYRFVCSEGDILSGSFEATVGGVTNDIDFFVFDSENYGKFAGYETYSAALQYKRTGGRTWTFTVPNEDT